MHGRFQLENLRSCIQLGLEEDALDDAVHECAQAGSLDELNSTDDDAEQEDIISSSEIDASEINNGGVESQIEYLLRHNDAATVEQLIRSNSQH